MQLIMNILLIVLCIGFSSAFLRIKSPSRGQRTVPVSSETEDEENVPLILTPLLKAGKIKEARSYSAVYDLALNVPSNAGFFTVNETYNSNLYFWFFPKAGEDWKEAPVVLWLQGGPGCSSLFGLFTENGPLIVTSSGIRKRRKYPWTSHYNMLYIDQPIGTGFSFTDHKEGYLKTQQEVGEHLYEALVQFFQLYSELKNNKFYITGESYGGKYIPTVAYTIHQKNNNTSNPINLKGLMIGNGFSDPENMLHYAQYAHRLGLIDYEMKELLRKEEDKVKMLIRSKQWKMATNAWVNLLEHLLVAMRSVSIYDYTQETLNDYEKYVDYITSDRVRKLIHVGQRDYYSCSDQVWEDFQVDFMQSVKPTIEALLEHYPIMFFSGQLDIICAYPLSESYFHKFQWSGAEEYMNAAREVWKVGKHVAGYYKSAGNLTDVLVRNAGHMVPMDQPKYALNLINKFMTLNDY